MSVTVTLEIPIHADKLEEFKGMMPTALIDTRKFKGCESYKVHVEQNTSTIFTISEWASRADNEAYLQWRTETGFFDEVAVFFSGEPIFRYFDQHPEI
jgi:quinol monooxygenase YgiN